MWNKVTTHLGVGLLTIHATIIKPESANSAGGRRLQTLAPSNRTLKRRKQRQKRRGGPLATPDKGRVTKNNVNLNTFDGILKYIYADIAKQLENHNVFLEKLLIEDGRK